MKKIPCLLLVLIIPLFSNLSKETTVFNSEKISYKLPAKQINEHKIFLKTNFAPKDPYYTGASRVTSPLGNVYQNISFNYIGNIENVWDKYTGKNVTIAVIDTGLDINHPDFAGKIDEKSGYFYTEGNTPKSQIGKQYISHDLVSGSYSSHGTNTAGAALAGTGNEGTIGVAPDANLLALKCDLEDLSVNNAIRYAVDNGAKVINLSLGAYAEKYYNHRTNKWYDKIYEDYFPGCNTSMQDAIDYAYEHDVIVVASAGNETTSTHSYPAANNHVIGVGSLEYASSSTLAVFSNFNGENEAEGSNCNVDIVAPGYVVTPSYNGSSTYVQTQGTSFSSPIVAGAAALWLEKNPDGTPDQFLNDLAASCKDIGKTGWDTSFGYGSLDVEKLLSLMMVDQTPIKISVGQTYQIRVSSTGEEHEVNFVSNNEKVVTVTNEGLVTAVAAGKTSIVVMSGTVTRTIDVTVLSNNNPLVNGFGCGGNISTTSTIISLLSITFVSLLILKKKKIKTTLN